MTYYEWFFNTAFFVDIAAQFQLYCLEFQILKFIAWFADKIGILND